MRLVTVGTGTVVPDPERASACYWVEEGETRVVVDCGAGALQGLARAKLAWGAIGHLVISHFHADHIGAIPPLIFALRHALAEPRTEPLHVWGPEGTRRLFQAWAGAYGSWVTDPGFDIILQEVGPGRSARIGGLVASFAPTPHTEESLALRLETAGSTLGYTGDTGPDEKLGDFLHGVDLLLAECSLPDDLAVDIHLSPKSLARLATAAGAARLVVTHVYPQLQRLDAAGLIRAAGYSGAITMASDGLELTI